MLSMKKTILQFIFLGTIISLQAQQFVGGRLNRGRVDPSGFLPVEIHTYTLGNYVPIIEVDWGDGNIEEIQAGTNAEVDSNLFWNHYSFYHLYETPGTYTVSYTDSFWVDDIVNLTNSGEKLFQLAEEVVFSDTTLLNRPVGIRSPMPFNFLILEDGTITLDVNYLEFELDSVALRFRPFPDEGYSLPPATDTLICCLEWRTPPTPGRYLFSMEAAEFRNGEEISTNALYIALDVPAISSIANKSTSRLLKLFPNPTAKTIYLESECTGKGTGVLTNALGQIVYTLSLETPQKREVIHLPDLPPGSYSFRWKTANCDLVKQVVIF